MALQSEEVGWSVITKTVGRSEVVLVQGHPEYDPSSLVREYAATRGATCGHERDDVPCLPLDCVAARTGTSSAGCMSGWWAASGTRPW